MRHIKFILLVPTILTICSITISTASLQPPTDVKAEKLRSEKLPDCAACRVLVESFQKGIEKTKRGKFEGGDTAWEEDNQKSYARSEVRLTEIQENLCKDVVRGEIQCHDLAEELEATIEEWWFKFQDQHPDLFGYICVDFTARCCPKDHWGKECTACPGYPDNVCNNNGKCRGAGTRKGNGTCLCDKGYAGDQCGECDKKSYQSYKDETKLLCSSCHDACADGCTGAGAGDCVGDCKKGWVINQDKGCVDVNECVKSEKYCPGNQFCVNKDGGYSCLKCDRACNGCTADGPDMCTKCADDHEKKDNVCINTDILGRKRRENWARYATYFGLCLATYIILQGNVYAASVIGLMVALYISVSEYMIATTDVQNTTPNLDFLPPAH
ncbi:cysteine-rich with EGF-like domain protein 2 [Microplitis mediator]|uniref:cysteine-rich with EGF-like domain protein 2 n=1 Tax=Microplitis mediator TaxID=375433 RepID=UPI002556374C|nr:cysteine-rich with EGF-like domain protein 2 [Microplitis mediator]